MEGHEGEGIPAAEKVGAVVRRWSVGGSGQEAHAGAWLARWAVGGG